MRKIEISNFANESALYFYNEVFFSGQGEGYKKSVHCNL